jgi:hypothetical protein
MSSTLPDRHPASIAGVQTAFEALYNWDYEPEIDELRTLYANALDRQWIALKQLDWEQQIDHDAFSRTFSLGGIPIQETQFWQNLPAETRWEIARRSAAFMLSNFLHGEQAALMVAAQLVNAVPHMDAKFYAATQTLDEARHVEVFAAYIRKVLGASASDIVVLLSREFAVLVLIAFAIAAPVGYFVMNRWLQDFAYRMTLGPGTFLVAGIGVLLLALLTVSYQAHRAARSNPVQTLRYE